MGKLQITIFDFDDTLVATRSSRFDDLIKVAADLDYHLITSDIQDYWGKPFDQLISGIMPGVDFTLFQERYANFLLESPPRELPGTHQLLSTLTQHGVRIFVVSSGSHLLIQQDLEKSQLWQYISRLWAYEDTAYHKPDPRTLDTILSVINEDDISSDQILYIGDSLADFQIATANSIPFCAVLTGLQTREDFRSVGLQEHFIVNSLKELLVSKSWLFDRLDAKQGSR